MKKIRASYSFLHEWSRGNVDNALLSYFHVERPTPPQYVNGKKWDKYCQDYIDKNEKLPPEWGGDVLKNPKTQEKFLVEYNEQCNITGVFDVRDGTTLIELKSGHSASARQYSSTHQVPLYILIADIQKIKIDVAKVIRYNPKTNEQDRAEIYPSERILNKAMNYLDTLVPEIWEYFDKNDLFEKTDEQMAKELINYV